MGFLAVGLFCSFFVLLFLLTVPVGIYQTSPLDISLDTLKRWLINRLKTGERAKAIHVLQKTHTEVIKTALVVGIGLGLLTLALGLNYIGIFAVPFAVVITIGGIFLTEKVIENEFKMWQSQILEDAPTLVNFVPAFLEVGTVTPRESISMTLPFLKEPLKSEVWSALDKITRTGSVNEAMAELAERIKHPCIDSVCFRLSAAWESRVSPDIFDDLNDQIEDMKEIAATQATVTKSGLLALICVFGLVGAMLIFGYPGWRWIVELMSGGFGV